jgi:hypothetical protein
MVEETFDAWLPADYLRDYYGGEVAEDERYAIRYFVEQQRHAKPGPTLCFGCGPTLHHVFSAAPHATTLYLADYLPANLAEIDKWRRRAPDAHDWRRFVHYTLACEFLREPTDAEVTARLELTRERISDLLPTDAGLDLPLGRGFHEHFSTVLSPFCADSATADRTVWARYSRNIASLVKPGGCLLTSALRRCTQYKVGQRFFPSANIDEHDLRGVLAQDFRKDAIRVEVQEVPEHADQGYSGILLARSEKA